MKIESDEVMKKKRREIIIHETSQVLVYLDRYPELDTALRENKSKSDILDMITTGVILESAMKRNGWGE